MPRSCRTLHAISAFTVQVSLRRIHAREDDFYLNLVDWSSANVLSVGAAPSSLTTLCMFSQKAHMLSSILSEALHLRECCLVPQNAALVLGSSVLRRLDFQSMRSIHLCLAAKSAGMLSK